MRKGSPALLLNVDDNSSLIILSKRSSSNFTYETLEIELFSCKFN